MRKVNVGGGAGGSSSISQRAAPGRALAGLLLNTSISSQSAALPFIICCWGDDGNPRCPRQQRESELPWRPNILPWSLIPAG